MSFHEITDKVNELAANWEQFKVLNEQRLKSIEKHGAPDPITLEQMHKLNDSMDEHQNSISRIEAMLARPKGDHQPLTGQEKEYKSAFCHYLRKGYEQGLAQLEKKALSVSSDSDGGYLVTHYMAETMIRILEESSPMRQLAQVTTISTDAIELIEDREDAFAGWTAETESREDTKTPTISKKIIPVHELYAQPKATQKLIDDASIDIENWLANKLSDVFARKENDSFIKGDGMGKPRGILTYEAGNDWGEIEQISSPSITPESLYELYFSLKEIYTVKAKFLMSRSVLQAVRMLKDPSSGKHLWQPSLAAGNPDTILGCEVVQCADMPGIMKNQLVMAFADFRSAYQIVDRQGIRMLRDPFTDKPYVKFYTTKRVGGDVINFEVIKLLKISG